MIPTATECGADFWLALGASLTGAIGLVIAVAAALYAKRSAESAKEAVAVARAQFELMEEEHQWLSTERKASADLAITLTCPIADEDGVVRTSATSTNAPIEIGIENTGDKAAGPTTVNLLAPTTLPHLRWTGPNGEDEPDGSRTAKTSEPLIDDAGKHVDAKYLSKQLPRVGVRDHIVLFVRFSADTPPGSEPFHIPFKATASADEMPGDAPEATALLSLKIARVETP